MDCPGAVSLSASKAVLDFASSIVVDLTEVPALPSLIKDSYRTGAASVPLVIVTDPGISTIYSRLDYPAMKTQKYTTIFKETKKEIKTAQKEGTFSLGEYAPVVVTVANSEIISWKSSNGTEIRAKLTGVEDDTTYIFETAAGKTIRATAKQLSKDSVTKARELAGLK